MTDPAEDQRWVAIPDALGSGQMLGGEAWIAPLLSELFESPALFAGAQSLNEGGRASVRRLRYADRALVIKRYHPLPASKRVVAQFIGSRAQRSWRAYKVLRRNGIVSAPVYAWWHDRIPGKSSTAWLIMGEAGGTLLSDVIASGTEQQQLNALQALATLYQQLAKLQATHGDGKATNYMVQGGKPGTGSSSSVVTMLDLDPVRFHRLFWTFQYRRARDLARLLKNWSGHTLYDTVAQELSGWWVAK